ncbi:acid protease [Backusella circina FSU 941]|nr:acid protease [Backusella circina FSU 941]
MKIQLAIPVVATAVAITNADAEDQKNGIIRAPILRNDKDLFTLARQKYTKLNRRAGVYNAPLYNDQGSQYLIEVGIGSPPQKFPVTLDTGSADLWVPSTQCPASSCPFDRFNIEESSTFKSLEQSFGIQYGIGSVNGTYATDTVTVGGVSIHNQQFGLASTTADILQPSSSSLKNKVNANGILGLGYPSLTQANSQGEGPYNPFVFNLVKQNVIKEPVFSIFLDSISKPGWAGEIIFGGVDTSKFDGNLTYLPVAGLTTKTSQLDSSTGQTKASYYYWMVYGQGLGVIGTSTDTSPRWKLREVGAFILDTGTTLTYLPTSVATDIVTAFAGEKGFALDRQAGVFVVDCNVAKSKTKFELEMSQSSSVSTNPVVLTVPASELVIPLDAATASQANTCMFGIAPLGSAGGIGNNMYLVGDSILRSAYMVFDMGHNRVGLAAAKNIGGSVTLGTNSNTPYSPSTSTYESGSADVKRDFAWLSVGLSLGLIALVMTGL